MLVKRRTEAQAVARLLVELCGQRGYVRRASQRSRPSAIELHTKENIWSAPCHCEEAQRGTSHEISVTQMEARRIVLLVFVLCARVAWANARKRTTGERPEHRADKFQPHRDQRQRPIHLGCQS